LQYGFFGGYLVVASMPDHPKANGPPMHKNATYLLVPTAAQTTPMMPTPSVHALAPAAWCIDMGKESVYHTPQHNHNMDSWDTLGGWWQHQWQY